MPFSLTIWRDCCCDGFNGIMDSNPPVASITMKWRSFESSSRRISSKLSEDLTRLSGSKAPGNQKPRTLPMLSARLHDFWPAGVTNRMSKRPFACSTRPTSTISRPPPSVNNRYQLCLNSRSTTSTDWNSKSHGPWSRSMSRPWKPGLGRTTSGSCRDFGFRYR